MTWWQTLIVAVVPVLITLLITNVAESRRMNADRKQRESDREHALTLREADLVSALEERWRDERKAAHIALLTTLQLSMEALHELARMEAMNLPNNPDLAQADDQVRACIRKARDQLTEVELIGSTPASERASVAVRRLRAGYSIHRILRTQEREAMADAEAERVLLRKAREEYLRAAREELGTALV